MRLAFLSLLAIGLAACSGGAPPAPPPDATVIDTPGIEAYTTDHNGHSRVRLDLTESAADDAILGQFDDASPDSPAGYRNLVTLTEARYARNMTIEVIAEVTGADDVVRILRITADQAPFDNLDAANGLIAEGRFYFRGAAQVYAVVDGGALQVGRGDLENMVVDFDSETVSINIRTPFDPGAGSAIETEIAATGIPLNVVTGAFGGAVTMTTRSGETGDILSADGMLRGNLNGDARGLSRLVENMTASGLFTIGGDGGRFQADGVFWGSQLNYAE